MPLGMSSQGVLRGDVVGGVVVFGHVFGDDSGDVFGRGLRRRQPPKQATLCLESREERGGYDVKQQTTHPRATNQQITQPTTNPNQNTPAQQYTIYDVKHLRMSLSLSFRLPFGDIFGGFFGDVLADVLGGMSSGMYSEISLGLSLEGALRACLLGISVGDICAGFFEEVVAGVWGYLWGSLLVSLGMVLRMC